MTLSIHLLLPLHSILLAEGRIYWRRRRRRRRRPTARRKMQIREAEVAVGAPPPIPSTLSTSTSCQSRPSPCHPSTAHPNAPLGAGLCIFNKFRECSKPAISGGGCSEGGFSAASQTVSSRLFMCEAFAILSVPHRPPPYQRPRPHLSHSFSLSRLPFSLFLLIPSLRE